MQWRPLLIVSALVQDRSGLDFLDQGLGRDLDIELLEEVDPVRRQLVVKHW